MKKYLILIALIVASTATAAPRPQSAVITTEGEIVVNGTEFGIKFPVEPMLWDTFESGPSGEIVAENQADIGTWGTAFGDSYTFYEETFGYGSCGNQSAVHDYTDIWNTSLGFNNYESGFKTLYIDFKRYYPSRNGKYSSHWPYSLYGNNDNTHLFKSLHCENGAYGKYVVDGNLALEEPGLDISMNKWQHYQLMYDELSGSVFSYLDGMPDGIAQGRIDLTPTIDEIRIGGYFNRGDAGTQCDPIDNARIYTDNVYIDNTWQRVELGDNPNYSIANREIQIPQSWQDDSIVAKLNKGKLFEWDNPNHNENLWVFVSDEENYYSNTIVDREGPTPGSIIGDVIVATQKIEKTFIDDQNYGIRYMNGGERLELIYHTSPSIPRDIEWTEQPITLALTGQIAIADANWIDTDYTSTDAVTYIGSYFDDSDNTVKYVTKRKY